MVNTFHYYKKLTMTQELVTNVGFRRVQWLGMMPNVLSAEKDTKGQAIQKISGGQQPRNRSHSEIALLHQEFTNVLLLGNMVSTVSAVLLHELERFLWKTECCSSR